MLGAIYVFTLGLAFAVAVLHAYFRDVAPILSAGLLPWFMLSPIFFRPERITQRPAARFVLEWVNPIAPFIQGIRAILYGGTAPSLAVLAYCVVAAGVALAVGSTLFRRMQGELAVVV